MGGLSVILVGPRTADLAGGTPFPGAAPTVSSLVSSAEREGARQENWS